MRKATHRWSQRGHFPKNYDSFFFVFDKVPERPSPPPPSRYASVHYSQSLQKWKIHFIPEEKIKTLLHQHILERPIFSRLAKSGQNLSYMVLLIWQVLSPYWSDSPACFLFPLVELLLFAGILNINDICMLIHTSLDHIQNYTRQKKPTFWNNILTGSKFGEFNSCCQNTWIFCKKFLWKIFLTVGEIKF